MNGEGFMLKVFSKVTKAAPVEPDDEFAPSDDADVASDNGRVQRRRKTQR